MESWHFYGGTGEETTPESCTACTVSSVNCGYRSKPQRDREWQHLRRTLTPRVKLGDLSLHVLKGPVHGNYSQENYSQENGQKDGPEQAAVVYGPLHDNIYAYTRGLGTRDCLLDMLTTITGKRAVVIFLDMEKAFELANRGAILTALSLAHNEELFRKETWASKTAQGIKPIQAEGSFLARTLNVPHPTYTDAPPWAESSLHFSITPLTDKKDNLTTTDLAPQAQRALAAGNTDGADVYFTDGSVDQTTNRAAAAFVHEEEIGHYRLPDHSSTLQTELIAIRESLEHAKTRQKHEVRRLAAEGSLSANWYCAAINDAKDTLMTTPRLVMTRLYRLRLGYHCLAELNDTLPITSYRHRATHHARERIPAPTVKEDTYQQLNNRTYTTSGPSLRQ
ncbi:hypothetical protein O3P69_006684 [Scylla paramamosain]|uniref:Reverse transcriptase domain-containing protein n=1 Tax=Scylla paramamosain TaxID=85552 RepID=A0AAW0U0E5_SCYPA